MPYIVRHESRELSTSAHPARISQAAVKPPDKTLTTRSLFLLRSIPTLQFFRFIVKMVADSLVYHPSVAHYLKFVSTTVGRDKLLRTIQYFSRFYAWYLFRTNGTPGEIAPWEAIKKQFGLIRKAMRVCLLSPRNWIKLKSRVVRKKYRAF
jgi:hypothetical protein